jgi:hypothetical protein
VLDLRRLEDVPREEIKDLLGKGRGDFTIDFEGRE